MMTRTINFGWHEMKESYHVECTSCGKKYKRTASRGFNDMATADDRAEYRRELKLDAEKYSKDKITCNACMKKGITVPLPVEVVGPEMLAEIAEIQRQAAALDTRKKAVDKQFRQHDHRLFIYKDETYAQSRGGASFSPWYDDGFTVHGYRVSKTRPWETTDQQVNAPLSEITYLDDTLDARKAKAKGAAS